jgi:hypothetical protein
MPPSRVRFLVVAALGLVALAAMLLVRRRLVVRLELDDGVRIALKSSVPFRTTIEQALEVAINHDIETRAKLSNLTIDLDEFVDVPIKMNVSVPIDSDVLIDQPLDVAMDVPIDTVLSEKELDLNQLEIPIDDDVFIDDAVNVETVLPVNTTVTTTLGVKVPVSANIPIKMRVPIRQKLHVKQRLKLALKKVRVPLHMTVPIRTRIPIRQKFRVKGVISAPVEQTLRVPIKKRIRPKVNEDVAVAVRLTGKLPAEIKGNFDSVVRLDKEFEAHIGPLQVSAENVTLHLGR